MYNFAFEGISRYQWEENGKAEKMTHSPINPRQKKEAF